MNNQLSWRNGWQLLRCTGVPLEARTCANSMGVRICPASSRRFSSFQAGCTLLYTAGTVPSPYQPMPNPSPFVVNPPSLACRLWSMMECAGRNSSSSAGTGLPM
jgi:hypothetical protein